MTLLPIIAEAVIAAVALLAISAGIGGLLGIIVYRHEGHRWH